MFGKNSCIFSNRTSIHLRQTMSDIWTIKDVARYLKLTEKTAYRLVVDGEIPGFKVGGSWRFTREEIEQWIKNRQVRK
jgi:excisionase family DNA binding protein